LRTGRITIDVRLTTNSKNFNKLLLKNAQELSHSTELNILEPFYLKFDKDIFDWTGKRVKSSDSTEAMGGIVQQLSANNKLFITSLKESLNNKFQAENGSELPATQKADLLLEDINTLFELEAPPDDVKNMVLYLYDRLKKVNADT
jgi:hypothetical protein